MNRLNSSKTEQKIQCHGHHICLQVRDTTVSVTKGSLAKKDPLRLMKPPGTRNIASGGLENTTSLTRTSSRRALALWSDPHRHGTRDQRLLENKAVCGKKRVLQVFQRGKGLVYQPLAASLSPGKTYSTTGTYMEMGIFCGRLSWIYCSPIPLSS